jgi:drug/metabolite transporter (DMT)-like permease
MSDATSDRQRVGRGAVMALLAALLFGLNGTVSKLVLASGLVPGELMALRVGGAGLLLVGALAITRPMALRVRVAEVPGLLLYGLVGVSLVQWFYFVAIERLPVGIALLIEFTAPLFVALWVRFVRREPVRRRIWAAVALSLAGLALVGQVGPAGRLDRTGLAAAAGSALALALYLLTSERALAGRDAESLAAYGFLTSSLVWLVLHPWWSFPFATLAEPTGLPAGLALGPVPVGALVVWVVVLGTVVPFLLTLRAIGHAGAARVGLVGTSEPLVAGFVAWLVLGEALSGLQLAGVVIVVVGIALAVTARAGRALPSTGPARARAGRSGADGSDVTGVAQDARDARGVEGTPSG